eukprot:5042342-Amphidinium_carterae.1
MYPTSDEQEYTAELAFAIATALSMQAAATGRYKLTVPHPPKPHETGDRVLWHLWPAHFTRSTAMVGVGLRLAFHRLLRRGFYMSSCEFQLLPLCLRLCSTLAKVRCHCVYPSP